MDSDFPEFSANFPSYMRTYRKLLSTIFGFYYDNEIWSFYLNFLLDYLIVIKSSFIDKSKLF